MGKGKPPKAKKEAQEGKPFVVNGPRLRELIGNAETARVKYVRLLSVPDNPRSIDTLVEFMGAVSDWSERDLGELTVPELVDLFKSVRLEAESEAVDPTPDGSSNSGDSELKTPSPDSAKS